MVTRARVRFFLPIFFIFAGASLLSAAAAWASEGSAAEDVAHNDVPHKQSDLDKPAFGSNLINNQSQLLAKARTANDDLYSTLKSFVCREDIQRYKGDLEGRKIRPIDRVTASLSFENGVEHYSEIRQNTHSRASISSLGGAWSAGEFGTLLQQTERLLDTQSVSFVAFSSVAGVETGIYHFEVSSDDSPWDLEVSERHYRLAFETDVWISVSTGEILKISRKSKGIPAETRISEISWDVTLDAVDINSRRWLLPVSAAYSVSYAESKRREWNEMSFSGYRRYGSEVSLRFQ